MERKAILPSVMDRIGEGVKKELTDRIAQGVTENARTLALASSIMRIFADAERVLGMSPKSRVEIMAELEEEVERMERKIRILSVKMEALSERVTP